MSEYLPFAILFGILIVGYLFAGAIDARLQVRHSGLHEKLGSFVDSRPLNRDSVPRAFRWLRFLTYEHFQTNDPILSGLCLGSMSLSVSVIAWMLGFF